MANPGNTDSFRLPPPSFGTETKKSLGSFNKLRNPHFSTPSGMLLPRDNQPPPMYGPRGSTVPPWLVRRPQQHQYNPKGSSNNHPRPRGQHRGHTHYSYDGYDKDVIPDLLKVDWSLWCEGCDVNCRTEDELKKHISEHRTCDIVGCKYVGHPGVMKRHWKIVHDEKKLQEKAHMESKQSPEDIDKWRAERKLRYPSKNNILRRQKEQEEKIKRGERIEEDKKKFPQRNQQLKNKQQRNFRRGAGKQRSSSKKSKTFVHTIKEPDNSDDDTQSRICFEGTSKLNDYKDDSNSLMLLCGYGSDSEEHSTEEEPQSVAESCKSNLEPSMSVPKQNISDGEIVDSEPETAIIQIKDESTTNNINETIENDNSVTDSTANEGSKNKRKRNRKRRHDETSNEPSTGPSKVARIEKPLLNYSKLRHTQQNTLLEKLLEPDIRHERNILLQCVRFVVQNDFFGIGQTVTIKTNEVMK